MVAVTGLTGGVFFRAVLGRRLPRRGRAPPGRGANASRTIWPRCASLANGLDITDCDVRFAGGAWTANVAVRKSAACPIRWQRAQGPPRSLPPRGHVHKQMAVPHVPASYLTNSSPPGLPGWDDVPTLSGAARASAWKGAAMVKPEPIYTRENCSFSCRTMTNGPRRLDWQGQGCRGHVLVTDCRSEIRLERASHREQMVTTAARLRSAKRAGSTNVGFRKCSP
jgi:hypothetical protein